MRSICFFSSYFNGGSIPFYVKIYLDELKGHFSQIVFLTNEKKITGSDLKYLADNNFQTRYYKNEGFDFGMWYKAFMEFPVLEYDRIGLVNDSCILFKKLDFFFDWLNNNNADYCGITDSSAIAYHLQSYFVVMNAEAIKYVYEYFNKHKIKSDIKNVIHQYEVGLSTYLLSKNLKLNSFFKHENNCGQHNPMLFYSDDLIRKGMPFIKKKIIFSSFRKEEYVSLMLMNFNIDPRVHLKLIKQINGQEMLFNFDMISKDIYTKKFLKRVVLFKTKSFFYRKLQKLRRYRTFNRINEAIGKYLYSGL